jgi:phthalate 4,5-cis-dihydrodiol dehydrogenase
MNSGASDPAYGTPRTLRFGVAGLGRAFSLMLPTLVGDPRVRVVAGADPRAGARDRFTTDFGVAAHASVEALCSDANVDVIYVATPHEMHAEHAMLAARNGKHVLVEKPMALSVADCTRMIEVAASAGVQLCIGHSHSFDAPIRRTREFIASGAFGAVRMLQALYYTDFLYRPRRPEELDTARGGGAVWNQAAHQIDIVRLLGGGRLASVRALTGNWDRARNTEGAYVALLTFDDGAFASLTYNGYGHFDSDEFCGWKSELGVPKDPAAHGAARRALAGVGDAATELALKSAHNYGGPAYRPSSAVAATRTHEHFGTFIVSCERADLRPMPDGVMIYDDGGARLDRLAPPTVPRREVIDELYAAIQTGTPALHDGHWARATLEACAAVLESARTGRDVTLVRQIRVPNAAASQ